MMKTVEILQYNLHKGTGAFFHNVMAELAFPFINATASMWCRLVTLCTILIATISFEPLKVLKI